MTHHSEKPAEEKISIGSEVGKKVHCIDCKKEGTTDHFITMLDEKGKNIHYCQDCKEKLNMQFEEETKDPNWGLAVLGGALGGAIGGALWFGVAIGTGREIGYLSLALGYLVGYGVYFGAGKKRGQGLQIMSAVIALATMFITEKLMFDYFVNDFITKNAANYPDWVPGTKVTISLLDPVFLESIVSPVGLLIYAIGIYLAYSICKPKKIG